MRLPALVVTGLLLATFAVALVPTAEATAGTCPPPYVGVWVHTLSGRVYMCCNFTVSPPHCYVKQEPA